MHGLEHDNSSYDDYSLFWLDSKWSSRLGKVFQTWTLSTFLLCGKAVAHFLVLFLFCPGSL